MKHIPSVSPGQVKKVLKAAGQGRKKAKKVRRCRAMLFRDLPDLQEILSAKEAPGPYAYANCPNPALPGGDFCEEHKA